MATKQEDKRGRPTEWDYPERIDASPEEIAEGGSADAAQEAR